MPYNHKQSSSEKYLIVVNNKEMRLSEEQIGKLIKKKLKSSRVVNKIFKEFEVSIDQVDNLIIDISDLDGRYAETDLTTMTIDPSIVEDVLTTNFFIVLHEICGHFTTRRAEEKSFFADPEEVFGMVAGCAGMLEQGYDFDTIYNIMWPKIEFHFHDTDDARRVMKRIFIRAKKMLQ